jgi:hypothetical protein
MASFARIASVRARRALAVLAVAAILVQLLGAVSHEATRARATHKASAVGSGFPVTVSADAGHPGRPHDSADCAMCRAVAHARNALGSASLGATRSLPPRLVVSGFECTDVRSPLARSTITPRGPPA